MKGKTEFIHISQIKSGDTVIHEGQIQTVSGSNIKHDKFMGVSLFGDSYRLGSQLVARFTFKKAMNA